MTEQGISNFEVPERYARTVFFLTQRRRERGGSQRVFLDFFIWFLDLFSVLFVNFRGRKRRNKARSSAFRRSGFWVVWSEFSCTLLR